MATERQLEAALHGSLEYNEELRRFFLEKIGLPNKSADFKHLLTQEEIKKDNTYNKEGTGVIDILLKFDDITELAIELKVPKSSIDEKQIACHLYNLGIKIKQSHKNWERTSKKNNKIIKYLVIGAGKNEPAAVTKIKNKKRWNDIVYWISWQDMRIFIDQSSEPYKTLSTLLDELNIKSQNENINVNIKGLTLMANDWLKAWKKNEDKYKKARTEMRGFIESLEKTLGEHGFSEFKSNEKRDSYSFHGLFEKTNLEKCMYWEFKKDNYKKYIYQIGLNFGNGKLYGSIIPIKPTQYDLNEPAQW